MRVGFPAIRVPREPKDSGGLVGWFITNRYPISDSDGPEEKLEATK